MDIREFVFRHMHGGTQTGRVSSGKSNAEEVDRNHSLRMSTIVNDPDCRDMCARFLFTEIYCGGQTEPKVPYRGYIWEPLAEYFIKNIVSSPDFMHDCIIFFADIREGNSYKYGS